MNPTFIMMVGLPYSGKSYYAEKLSKEYGAVVYSSDAIRAEILGDVQDQNNNGKVFEVLHRRVYDDLSNGKSVIYDATNINYKRRMDTIQRLKRIPCEKVCYLMATPFSECVERSKYRDRVVPYEVLERMYKRYQRAVLGRERPGLDQPGQPASQLDCRRTLYRYIRKYPRRIS